MLFSTVFCSFLGPELSFFKHAQGLIVVQSFLFFSFALGATRQYLLTKIRVINCFPTPVFKTNSFGNQLFLTDRHMQMVISIFFPLGFILTAPHCWKINPTLRRKMYNQNASSVYNACSQNKHMWGNYGAISQRDKTYTNKHKCANKQSF